MSIRLLPGDCRDVLPTLPAESVQCVVTSPPYYGLRSYLDAEHPDKHREIGSEATPDLYLQTMVGVFREVRRVLRRDGTVWCNLGDSYASGEIGRHDGGRTYQDTYERKSFGPREQRAQSGLKPKDLLLMPARLALALQADGWWVRSDIIWHKPNPMPESVTDRPTSAHEHVFLITKSARYFYDADAVREEAEYGRSAETASWHAKADANSAGVRFKSTTTPGNGGSRNLRNVWTIATEPFRESHFATMPTAVVEKCVLAGTSERGCCAACGKPWGRVVEKPKPPREVYTQRRAPTDEMIHSGTRVDGVMLGSGQKLQDWRDANPATTAGWAPGCQCEALAMADPDARLQTNTKPCVVLDPFAGAGTTLLVADRLQRDAVGVELNTAYTEMAMERCRQDAPLFTSFPPAEPPEDERMADLFTDMAAD